MQLLGLIKRKNKIMTQGFVPKMKPLDVTWKIGYGRSIVLKCPQWGIEYDRYWGGFAFGDVIIRGRGRDGQCALQLWNAGHVRPEVTLKMILEYTEDLRCR